MQGVQTSDGAWGVGTTFRIYTEFLGVRIESMTRITEFETNERIVYQGLTGPLSKMENGYLLEPIEEGTLVTWTNEAELSGILQLAAPILERLTKRRMQGDLGKLKGTLESRPP